MNEPSSLLERLRRRKIVQYGLAYLAAAWVALQVASVVGDHFGWSGEALQLVTVLLAVGFPITLVLAWYHGDKGRQRVSGPELLMVAALCVVAGVALTAVRGGSPGASSGGASPADEGRRSELSSPPGSDRASIAVLPFDNLTGDPGQEYFSDGMTEEIITQLARLEGLKVISRSSTMRYKDLDRPLRDVGDELGVTTILEGSVRREGRRVKVTAQLIDAATDAHMWAETYDRELESVFEIQAEVARAIARELELRFSGNLHSSAEATDRYGTDDREALDLYLRARALWNLRTEEKLREAIELFREAVERDPGFAAAHAGMADALVVLPAYADDVRSPQEVYDRAADAAERALELDPGLAEARAALAMAATYGYRWETAGEQFRRALEGAPGYATVHQWYALYLSALGRMDEAVRHAERARALDPFAVAVTFDLAIVYYMARRYEAALDAVEQARVLSSRFTPALDFRRSVLEEMGRFEEAIETLELFLEESFGEERAREMVPRVRAAYREEGADGYYRALAEPMAKNSPEFLRAVYLGRSGDLDRAFELLNRAASDREFKLIHVGVAPAMDPMREDPRFDELLERMGLDPYLSGGPPGGA